jgi:AcrR family transcriptional regulator
MKLSSSPSKKRPYRMSARAETAATTGERLISAAWQHFASRSYDVVRLREIAEDAGVTAQTLHARFGSKEQLFTAAFMWWAQQEMTKRNTAPVGDAREAIRVLFDRYEVHGAAILRMLSQEERIPAVRRMTDSGRAYHRRWVERTFQPLLPVSPADARKRRVNAIVVASDLLVWKLLRLDMQLDRHDAERTVTYMIEPTRRG